MYCQFMLSSCSTNHADIKTSIGQTAVDMARDCGYPALTDFVDAFQPGPRGELAISCCTQYSQKVSSELHYQYSYI